MHIKNTQTVGSVQHSIIGVMNQTISQTFRGWSLFEMIEDVSEQTTEEYI
jgi:hypothetical protein